MTDKNNSQPVAFVTGAARGIGLAIANWFLAHKYRVVLIDIDSTTLAKTERELNTERALAIVCDISKPDQVQSAVDQVTAKFGRIDALVNNAGVAVFKPITETTFEEFRYVLGTNLDGAFLCSQACIPVMRKGGKGGAIVNIASISGLRASTLRIAYGTSKAALLHLTKQQAVELGTEGIRSNAVCPGPVDTEMAKLVHSVAIRSDYYDAIPMNRYATTEEIANAVGFLCSENAAFINGQFLAVDGGFDASGVGIPTLRSNQS